MATADDYFLPALSGAGGGAATGAMVGSMFPGPGTAIGAGVGGGIGLLGGLFQGRANAQKKKGMAQARKEMQELARKQYAQRMADLQRTMEYFKPANDRLRRLYGSDAAVDYQAPPGRML